MNPTLKKVFLFGLAAYVFWNCSGTSRSSAPHESLALSAKVQASLRTAVQATVGVAAIYTYRNEVFNHQLVDGQLVPDAASPTGFLLTPAGKKPIAREEETQKVNGVGLIIHRDESRATILTSAHIFLKPDTITTYYRDNQGRLTGVMLARAIKIVSSFFVIGQINQYLNAEVIIADAKSDLALLAVSATPGLGIAFPFEPSYETDLDWGDFAYVIGYPREVRQITSGYISKTTNPGAFVLDVVARHGYSGGPVFALRSEGELALVGLIRGVPVHKLYYVSPPPGLGAGQVLIEKDLKVLSAQELDLIDYGTTYAISMEIVGRFLRSNARLLERRGIVLEAKYFPY